MNYRTLGKTGLRVPEIGFGCGPTAGMMINGSAGVRREGAARAIELGIAYFDTAPIYGDTVSEANVGQALAELGAKPIIATKVALEMADLDDIAASVVRSIDASLHRLRVDSVEIMHLHNRVGTQRAPRPDIGVGALLTVNDVLGPNGVVEGMERARQAGKIRYIGCCSFGGKVESVNQLIDSGRFDSILVYYNLLNPTAFVSKVETNPLRDYGKVAARAAARGMGVVVLRALEGGVLAALAERHPLSRGTNPASAEFQAGLARARAVQFLTEDGHQTLAQAAIRFVLSNPSVSTTLVGFSDVAHMQEAAAASDAGPLAPADLRRLEELYRTDFGFVAPV